MRQPNPTMQFHHDESSRKSLSLSIYSPCVVKGNASDATLLNFVVVKQANKYKAANGGAGHGYM